MYNNLKEKLDNIAKEANAVGVSALICNKDEIIYKYFYGKRDIENNLDTVDGTIYRIASISKVIVGMGIMMLHDEGKLNIYEDISKYLGYPVRNPNHPNIPITIEMVMTQTSSLCDGEDEKLGYDGVNGPKFYVSLERLLTDPTYEYYTDKTFLKTKPGEKFCYSNFGCGILACIIEKVTNMYFTDFIIERLLKPLDIDGSFRIEDIKNTKMVASLYTEKHVLNRNYEKFMNYQFDRYPLGDNFRGPAGGLFISGKDLSKIMRLLMNKGVFEGKRYLSESIMNDAREVHWQSDIPDGYYRKKGLQMAIMDNYGDRLYGHTGDAYGLKSFMLFNDDFGYIFFVNGAHFELIPEDMCVIQHDYLEAMVNETRNNK